MGRSCLLVDACEGRRKERGNPFQCRYLYSQIARQNFTCIIKLSIRSQYLDTLVNSSLVSDLRVLTSPSLQALVDAVMQYLSV